MVSRPKKSSVGIAGKGDKIDRMIKEKIQRQLAKEYQKKLKEAHLAEEAVTPSQIHQIILGEGGTKHYPMAQDASEQVEVNTDLTFQMED